MTTTDVQPETVDTRPLRILLAHVGATGQYAGRRPMAIIPVTGAGGEIGTVWMALAPVSGTPNQSLSQAVQVGADGQCKFQREFDTGAEAVVYILHRTGWADEASKLLG